MTATVSDILEARRRRSDAPSALTGAISLVAHASFLVFLAMISKPKPSTFVPQQIPIRIISPQALGRASSPQARPASVVPAPPAVEAPKPKHVIEKPEKVEAPSPKAMPLPKKTAQKPPAPAARPAGPAGPALELPSAGGSPTGEPGGTSSFGTSVSSFDAEFPFSYYVEQLLSLVGANWLKPNVPEGTACVIYFRIQRSGQVTEVKVETASALPYYDRAASRALFAANPLPPLPPEYPRESLGVHLRFQ